MTEAAFSHSDWMETQRKYWQAWADMGLNVMGNKTSGASPWVSALDHWWSALAPTAPDASRVFVDKLLDQSKRFLSISENLYRGIGPGLNTDEWNALVQKTFSDPFKNLTPGQGDNDEAMRRMLAFWELPFDNWQRMVSSLSLLPGDALRNMPHDQVKENLHRFLSAPGLGYTREEQGQYQDLVQRGLQYQSAMRDYVQFFSSLGIKSSERMQERLVALAAKGTAIDSAKGLYDLWVSCCEDVYAEQVMAPEYAVIHGRLINALMAFKHRMAAIVDETLGAMNMPTRAELRTLQDRLQETRRENKSLRRDLEALRELVAALDAGTTPAATVALAADAGRQSAVRRKSAPPKSE